MVVVLSFACCCQDFVTCWVAEVCFQVWTSSFLHKLAIRPRSQHQQCGLCVRHKALIKRLANDTHSRTAQMHEYSRHLKRQYADRVEYWTVRTQSRLRQPISTGNTIISLIIDGLDHSKLRFPRAELVMSSKEVSSFIRPNLDLQACLAHGYGIFCYLTWPTVHKDSNATADMLSNVMRQICQREQSDGSSFDCRCTELHLQSDNTTRETKNNTTLRLLSSWVGGSLLKRAVFSNLMTGHSHEDIDQWFSVCSSWIQDEKLLEQPSDFKISLERLLSNPQVREHEPIRRVELLTSVRDWRLGLMLLLISPQL